MTTRAKVRYDNRTPADRARLDAAVRRVLAEATRWLAVRDLAAALGLAAGERHDGLMISKAAGRLVAAGQARRRGARASTEYAYQGAALVVTRRAMTGTTTRDGAAVAYDLPARARAVASTMRPDGAHHEPGTWTVAYGGDEAPAVAARDLRFLVEETS